MWLRCRGPERDVVGKRLWGIAVGICTGGYRSREVLKGTSWEKGCGVLQWGFVLETIGVERS